MASMLVDTNVLIRYFRGDEPFAELIETSESVVVHPVVYAEYMNGLDEGRKSGKFDKGGKFDKSGKRFSKDFDRRRSFDDEN